MVRLRSLCLFCFVGFLSLSSSTESANRCSSTNPERVLKIGVVTDNTSRIGKEQRIAIEIAVQNLSLSSCDDVEFLLAGSPETSAQAVGAALDLVSNKKVKAMIGTLTREEMSLIFELNKASINVPIISLSSSSLVPPNPVQIPQFVQMADDIAHHMNCISAIVATFRWRKVTVIYEDRNDFKTNLAVLNLLSNSLKDVNSEVENQVRFSLSDPEAAIEEKLANLTRKSSRVFVVLQSSIEFAVVLFKQAKKLNITGNGNSWIVSDEISSLFDSLDSSFFHKMQGVIGFRTHFQETRSSFQRFRKKFRQMYATQFPEDEGETEPSIFALRAYDAYSAIAGAMEKLQGKFAGEELRRKVTESRFEGLSGPVSFKNNGLLSQLPTFQVVEVVGRSYKTVAFWSPESGFSDELTGKTMSVGKRGVDFPSLSSWPKREGPKFKKPLKIGVPATAAFPEFVRVNNLHSKGPHISGFSISVFEAVASNLNYFLPYDFVPFNGSYDDLLRKVGEEFDAAVGDFGIFAERFNAVEFSEPYLNNAAVMIVKEEALKWTRLWIFMKAFTAKMWVIVFSMHIFVSSVIWLIERKHNPELKGLGNMLWFSVSVIFFVHREPVKNGLARLVLGPWLFVILIMTASFTASLSSMLTISRSQPSVLDVEALKLSNATVGCNKNSVMVQFLTKVLNFQPENIRQIPTPNDFPGALTNEDIQAVFISGPHADVFLAKYCKGYTRATVFKLVGMGFAFPKGSSLTVDISASIAELTERRELPDLATTLLSTFNCTSHGDSIGSGLGPEPFVGLFLIAGIIAATAVLITAGRLALMNLGWITEPTPTRAQFFSK